MSGIKEHAMTTAEILRAAAARVRQGWCQKRMSDGRGGVCALGALDVSAPDRLAEREAGCALFEALGFASISQWNDAPDQTAENVARGLEFAALISEQEHLTPAEAPALEASTA